VENFEKMDNPPRIPPRPRYNVDAHQNRRRKPVAQSQQKDCTSHKTKVTITTQTPKGISDQIIYPSSSRALPHSGSMGSETGTQASGSGCSAQTQKTGTTTTTALVLNKDGIGYYEKGKYANAMKSFNSFLKSQMLRRAEDDNPLLAKTLANIGSVYLRQDRYQHAIQSLENAVRMMRRSKRKQETNKNSEQQTIPTDVPLAGVLNNLGTAKFLKGDHKASLECYWEAVRDAKTYNGRSNKKELANSLYNIGRISVLQKDYPMALKMLNESLCLQKKLHGENSMEIVDTLNFVGFVHYSIGVCDRAVFVFTEALSIVTACFGSVHEKVAVSLINVGMVLEKEGDLDEALRCFSTAHDVCEKVGLNETNTTMYTAIRSANDIRRELAALVQEAGPSRQKKGNRGRQRDKVDSSFHQRRKTSTSGNPTAGATPKDKDPSCKIRSEGGNGMNVIYAAFKERRKSDQASIEYREDPHWEIDDSSMVEEDRDD
jgi:tetratricopeptide (TPR) repeat protein